MKIFNKSYFNNFYCESFKYKDNINLSINYTNIYKDGFIVQGFCVTSDYYIISAYSKECLSRIYLYNRDGFFDKYVELDNKAHVGGLAFDNINRLLFVTGRHGKINCYSYDDIICGKLKVIESNINISNDLEGHVSASTLFYYDKSLYICTCSCSGSMVKYDLEYKNNKILIVDKTISKCLSSCIQGLVVFSIDDKKYYLISQSYSKLKSIIKLFDGNNNFIGQKIIGFKGIEGIELDSFGNINSIFENGITKSLIVNINDLNKEINKRLEYKYFLKGKIHQEKLDKSN